MPHFENFDWSRTPLGPRETWSPALATTYEIMRSSHVAMCAAWGSEQTFIYNAAYAPFLGLRHPNALGQRIDTVWHDVWSEIAPLIERAMAGERVQFQNHHFVMTRNGYEEDTYWDFSYSALHDCGEVVGFLNVATEATHHVVTGQRRDADLRLYREIIQSSAAPICAFDTAYRLIAFNKAHSDEFYRIFAHRVRLGEVFPDLFPPEQATVMRGLMTRALAGEAYTVTEEFGDPALAKPYWEVSYSPLRDGAGQVIGAFHFAKDISARLRAETELAITQEALRQSQKMEAIGQLTGGVAHDFNNLLTIIRSSVDFLRRPEISEERRKRYMDAVSDTVDRAAKLTGQLLAFGRRQALKPEVFDVGARIRRVVDMLDTVTGSRIRIVSQMPDHPCFVRADASQFETALINIAVNARDAMNGEGTLTLRLTCSNAMPPIRGHAGGIGPFANIELSDTGSGIAKQDLARIFKPFFTTKEVGRGTGLGLSQVFGFAKQSGGDIGVHSVPGEGTTFTLYLPEVVNEADLDGAGEPIELAPTGGGQRVLVVEDNTDVGQFAMQILDDLGYATTWATSAEAALEHLGEDGAGFDAVFSDVVMPGMGGIALANNLRRRLPRMPVVLTSGYSHVLAEDDAHGFELLHKPYSADQLSRVLRLAMAKTHASRH